MSKKFVIGNWKMNPETPREARQIFSRVETNLKNYNKVTTIICPAFPHLSLFAFRPKRKISLGAQNLFAEPEGAFTGEVSARMLKFLEVSYVIVGHSERRRLGETGEIVNQKVMAALKNGLVPIVCIGESERDQDGRYLGLIKSQLEQALRGVPKKFLSSVMIAYEPVWAIGGYEAMNPSDIHEMVIYIKKILVDLYKTKLKMLTLPAILYGGSVSGDTAHEIVSNSDVDGLLVSHQSLDPRSFIEIIKSVN